MARVRLLSKEDASPEAKKTYDKLESNGARILNVYRAMAHSPAAMLDWMKLGNTLLSKAKLSARLREMAILRIALITGSKYEWAQHYPVALEAGITEKQAKELEKWQESKVFSPEERAVLQYTDEVAWNVSVKAETFTALQEFLSEQEIVELTLSIGFWGMTARFLVPLEVDIDIMTAGSASDLTGRSR